MARPDAGHPGAVPDPYRPTRVTIREVASRAAVAVGTVSRVINGARNIDPALRRRVEIAMADLGFEPDPTARTLRSRTSRVIGVMLPDISNPLTSAAIGGIEPVLIRAGYTMFLANSHADLARERQIIEQFKSRRVDGIIAMVACDTDPATHRQLSTLPVPVVQLERDMELDADSVRTDQFDGTYRATRYLLGLGHERITIITVPETTLSGRERLRGYRAAFADCGVSIDDGLIFAGGRERPYARDAAYASLTMRNSPTALIASGGHLAGAIEAIRLLNLKVPDQLSVLTLGDTELAGLLEPAVTAIRYDWAATGRQAAELLTARLLDQAPSPRRHVVLSHQLVQRGSCSPPPTRRSRDQDVTSRGEPFHSSLV